MRKSRFIIVYKCSATSAFNLNASVPAPRAPFLPSPLLPAPLTGPWLPPRPARWASGCRGRPGAGRERGARPASVRVPPPGTPTHHRLADSKCSRARAVSAAHATVPSEPRQTSAMEDCVPHPLHQAYASPAPTIASASRRLATYSSNKSLHAYAPQSSRKSASFWFPRATLTQSPTQRSASGT